MNVQKGNYTPSFKSLYISQDGESAKVLRKALESSKALQKFGKRYNAELNYVGFSELNNANLIHPAVRFSNIRPVNTFRKVVDFFSGLKTPEWFFFSVKAHGTTDKDFIQEFAGFNENTVLNIYSSFVKNL